MKAFWKFLLRKSLPQDSLCNLRYAVLGLGDSSYVRYNFVAKRLFKRLQNLGGQPITPLGLADDQHDLGYDGITDPWMESLFKELLVVYPLPNGVQIKPKTSTILPRWNVTSRLLQNVNNVNVQQSMYYSTRKSDDFNVEVIENKRITDSSHFQDVRLIKLRSNGSEYGPGDIVVLRPKNLQWQIDELQNVFQENNVKIKCDTVFKLSQNESEIPLPEVLQYEVTFSQLCEEYFDLMAIPRRFVFNILGQITDCQLEKEKCLEFTTAEGQNDLYTYCNRPKRNIVEVLRDFPNATKNITHEILFEIFSPIKPREFSIASSYQKHKNEIHILLAIVRYKTKLIKERFGLCSNYLADLKTGQILTAWLKHGSFKFPSLESPVIMVGPGTGVAPFRNYIHECISQNKANKNNLLLFFGCRNEKMDFHCQDEFLEMEKNDQISLVCAFSRDQDKKIYVQDKILQNSSMVWDFLNRGASIFVAGNAKNMPQEVRKAFLEICQNEGNFDKIEAEKFIINMEKNNKYQTECWS